MRLHEGDDPTILFLTASLFARNSRSHRLASELVRGLAARHPETVVIERKLDARFPHLTKREVESWRITADRRSKRQQQAVMRSDALLQELDQATILVLAAPMYNFSIPSTLKAWIDRIVRAGCTFRYENARPVALLNNQKKVFVISCRGGFYPPSSQSGSRDFQEPYLRGVFEFIGLTDITFVKVEGQNRNPGLAEGEWKRAQEKIETILRTA